MLRHRDDVVTLDGVDFLHGQRACEKRIFAEIFEVPAALRHAQHVHPWTFDHVHADVDRLAADEIAIRIGERRVP